MLQALLVFLLGLPVGALAGHAAELIMRHERWQAPHCPYCTVSYSFWEWSAVLALLTGHRCAQCGRPVRWQRLVGELLLAIVWAVLVYMHALDLTTGVAMAAVIPLTMVTVTDLETRLIPNRIVFPAIVIWLVVGFVWGPTIPGVDRSAFSIWSSLIGGLIGFFSFWLLEFFGSLAFGEGALGGGDVKLAGYIGLLVGFPLVIEALVLTFFLGGFGGLLVLIAKRGSLRTAIPYGPFIVLGTLAVMIWGVQISRWWLGGL